MSKVNLDALIPREDFEITDDQNKGSGKVTETIRIIDLEEKSFFFSTARKPDFQRETNEWSFEKICGFIWSFLSGDLIPAIILWKSASVHTFVIDGSHRLSALAAWVNDDYGDGSISKKFYDGIIPDEQLHIAEKTRNVIRRTIGSYKDHQDAVSMPEKSKPEMVARAKALATLAIQLQWVEGDASKAESSFFKINQEAVPINSTELFLLKTRRKPNAVAARAIIRSGTGHKYWSKFSSDRQSQIEIISKDINNTLFTPPLKTPIKTLDLPIGGKLYSSQTLSLVLDFVNIVNNFPPDDETLADDGDGSVTVKVLEGCRRISQRINSINPSSLGLHPAVYFYSSEGRHKSVSFYAITSLMRDFEDKKLVDTFIKVRESFEELLLQYEYFTRQMLEKYKYAIKAYVHTKALYLEFIKKLAEGKSKENVINEILGESNFSYLQIPSVNKYQSTTKEFTTEVKSARFLREALATALKCKICKGTFM